MLGRRRARDDEYARADDGADAEHDQAHRTERAMKLVLVGDNGIGLGEIGKVVSPHAIIPPAV